MANMKVEGADLRKLLKMGAQKTMSFAFCLDAKNNHTLIVDPRKPPEVLAKAAKAEGSSPKIAFGTFVLDGKILELTCVLTVPNLAKILKDYLQAQKFPLKVAILDEDGNLLEGDSEDDVTTAKFSQPDVTASDDTRQLAEPLAKRLKALQSPMAAAPAKVKKVFATALTQFRNADYEATDKTVTALEQVATKLAATKPQPAANSRALVARAKALQERVATLDGPTASKLGSALAIAVKQIKANNPEAAAALLGKIETAANATMPPPATPNPAADKWAQDLMRLQPRFDKMIAEKRGDLSAMIRFFNFAKDQANAGNYKKALAVADRLTALLSEAEMSNTSAAVQEADAVIPDDVVAYIKSRLAWIKTRATLQKELATIKSEIDKKVAGIEGLEQVPSKSSGLFKYLDGIDSGLENTLEQLTETARGPARDRLKTSALQIIATYRDVLNTPFFKDIDKNGFVKTSIRATALISLEDVSTSLAL